MENMPIQVQSLTKRLGAFTLDDVSFDIPAGSIVGLIGENGAGKTTVIRLLLGLLRPDGGRILRFGDASPDNATTREDIGVVFDTCCFHGDLTVRRIDRVLSGVYRNWDGARFAALCDRFGLPSDRKVKDLSRGMSMKLSIAAAFAHRPKLLLLDEPTGGLDPAQRNELLDLLRDFLQDESHAALFSSHITSDLEQAADYIAYLHDGRLLFFESKDDLLGRYGVVRCGADALDRLDPADVVAYRRNRFGCDVLTPDRAAAKRRYPSLTVDPASLEDIMVFYGKGERR